MVFDPNKQPIDTSPGCNPTVTITKAAWTVAAETDNTAGTFPCLTVTQTDPWVPSIVLPIIFDTPPFCEWQFRTPTYDQPGVAGLLIQLDPTGGISGDTWEVTIFATDFTNPLNPTTQNQIWLGPIGGSPVGTYVAVDESYAPLACTVPQTVDVSF